MDGRKKGECSKPRSPIAYHALSGKMPAYFFELPGRTAVVQLPQRGAVPGSDRAAASAFRSSKV